MAAVVASLCIVTTALAQKFPEKPITLIIPFAPGGNLDIVGRTLAPAIGAALGQSVIVENRAGAGGAIGASYVARARPDGYTLMVSTPNAVVVSPLIDKTGYTLDSFAPIGSASVTPLLVMVQGKGRFANIAAVMAEARAKPGTLTSGHSGNGTTNHVALLQWENAANIKLNLVPYKGSGPALTDLMGGQLDLVVDQFTSSATFIKAGTLRAVATLSRERDPLLPDVPTLREAGVPDFDATTQAGLFAPALTPQPVVDALNAALLKALADANVKKVLASIGSPVHPSSAADWLATLKHEQASAQAMFKTGRLTSE